MSEHMECEVCGQPGARRVADPGGGHAEMCRPCLRDRAKQVREDALMYAAACETE